ncbi:MAG: hypothetical protein K2W95_08680 [Candidatus Obscuribacterales bacterium]|nr:hypothetical protein [Candidatus Obscuribacterales bacterium]
MPNKQNHPATKLAHYQPGLLRQHEQARVLKAAALSLTVCGAFFIGTSAQAQGFGSSTGTTAGSSTSMRESILSGFGMTEKTATPLIDRAIQQSERFVAQALPPSSTIIPTDTLPLPAVQNRLSFAENLQLRILQKLPARFYFNSTCEVSTRYETNPFQFPKKRSLLHQLPPPGIIRILNSFQQAQINDIIGLANNDDVVFRVLPNVTGGWTLTPKTRLYCNYFMIRDQLAHNVRLNTVIHSIGGGIQQDIPVTSRGNLQAEFQFRELYQLHQQSVFDFLPGLTFSYVLTPRVVLFANALLQLRSKAFFQAPTKEIDPFYTWGGLYQRNGWTFSASSTFVQNFREPFRGNASIPVNNYSFICDFEISRRILKELPGLQAFVRAEPIYNFHSHNRPGLAGMDFRMFFGMRMALAKPALTSALEQLRQQLEEQEAVPPTPEEKKGPKPSAFVEPHQVIASSPQPIHGYLDEKGMENDIASTEGVSEASPSKPSATTASYSTAEVRTSAAAKSVTELRSSRVEKKPAVEMVLVPPFPSIGNGQVPGNGQTPLAMPVSLH